MTRTTCLTIGTLLVLVLLFSLVAGRAMRNGPAKDCDACLSTAASNGNQPAPMALEPAPQWQPTLAYPTVMPPIARGHVIEVSVEIGPSDAGP